MMWTKIPKNQNKRKMRNNDNDDSMMATMVINKSYILFGHGIGAKLIVKQRGRKWEKWKGME